MSATEKIARLRELVRNAYNAIANKGGSVPEVGERTMSNLPAAISSIKHLDPADLDTAWDAFKGNTGMIPKEEQTIGNLKYAIRMNQEEIEPNEINFVDFNGMVLSMTIEEAMQLTELPKPREYYNLTFEHWTKTLEEIQDGRCHTVGAIYHTTDGCNYYVVEIERDGIKVELQPRSVSEIDWGDGTISPEQNRYSATHIYNKGTYVIRLRCDSTFHGIYACVYNGYTPFKEVYYKENVDCATISFRHAERLRKVCIPDNGTKINIIGTALQNCNKLKSFVISQNTASCALERWNYLGINLPSLEYLIADGCTGLWEPKSHLSLKAFSLKNITSVGTGTNDLYTKLQYAIFDNVTEFKSCFNVGSSYGKNSLWQIIKVVDLPETVTTIANNTFYMGAYNVYLRTLTPPTLGGTNVFFRTVFDGKNCTIHIRKDATYTDANGDTWTGLEAYAHATNWATLYTTTNYYTFVDDL